MPLGAILSLVLVHLLRNIIQSIASVDILVSPNLGLDHHQDSIIYRVINPYYEKNTIIQKLGQVATAICHMAKPSMVK